MIYNPNTFSNINEVKTTHLDLNFIVDFKCKILDAVVTLKLVTLVDNVSKIILDTCYLNIKSVSCCGAQLEHNLADITEKFSSALHIQLNDKLSANTKFDLIINYCTSAVQWLEPIQTSEKNHPYLFIQCQAIHARSLAPCQDTPAFKLSYHASVQVPQPLRALISAVELVGNLCCLEICRTEKFIEIGEKFLTLYEWNKYELLVLPASFPYGGMENPCLTFVTPTLLAGDRSLVDVVSHEIPHSWMGNLEHFWLNEGWTVSIERKIMGRLHGEATAEFDAIIGWRALEQDIELFGESNVLTALTPKLKVVDPDDSFSSVPYKKGCLVTCSWNVKNEFDHTLAKACHELAERWHRARDNQVFDEFSPDDIKIFTPEQTMVFLERLFEFSPLPFPVIEALINFIVSWMLAIPKYDLDGNKPLYRLLNQTKNGSELAKKTFRENKSFYHPIAVAMIEKDILK
ncbi:leukotriene A-4 hydrol [Gigaspora margarita]|uniref:Leukotriene A-4 hydrol n=1 Tax=Gigaspora margarita TaxID=4874 RepID=A0A8H4EQW1_GIGMA|nr:leukotriene A-4 hydrol [Gigaspora margarita]